RAGAGQSGDSVKKAIGNGRGGPMCPPVRRADTQVGPYTRRALQNPKWIGLVVAFAVAFSLCGAVAQAQQTGKVYRIGVLSGGVPGSSPDIEAFRQGLRDLGYVEGKNLVIEYRYTERKADRYPDLLSDLV